MDIVSSVMIGGFIFMCLYLFWLWFCFGTCVKKRQKTRNAQGRRQYIGTRARPSLSQVEPTIYVSPANLPPPPKYEAMAPPSYEEVVGIHYPNYQPTQIQPIAHPIATAMAQNTNASVATSNIADTPPGGTPTTVLSVTNERRTIVTSSS
ncbi:unnamed protein product [Parnassius apollo]|uniref:(apollo) hypothetical protein n=1 Tax=Parnassius apollo TaxID=110799 RepID=A0A8S3X0J6_PARAO|nr:unnamed protein product [Parnassius apollo]